MSKSAIELYGLFMSYGIARIIPETPQIRKDAEAMAPKVSKKISFQNFLNLSKLLGFNDDFPGYFIN